jgi:hypothetical protein
MASLDVNAGRQLPDVDLPSEDVSFQEFKGKGSESEEQSEQHQAEEYGVEPSELGRIRKQPGEEDIEPYSVTEDLTQLVREEIRSRLTDSAVSTVPNQGDLRKYLTGLNDSMESTAVYKAIKDAVTNIVDTEGTDVQPDLLVNKVLALVKNVLPAEPKVLAPIQTNIPKLTVKDVRRQF